MDLTGKLAIVVAPTGALNTRENAPYMAYTAEEQAQEARRCEEAGAPIYHVHVRDNKFANSGDPKDYGKLVQEVRKTSNALIQIGSAIGPRRDPDTGEINYPWTPEDRLAVMATDPKPDMYSLKIGAVELQIPGDKYSNVGLRNSPEFLRKAVPLILGAKQRIELEIFDVGAFHNAKKLEKEGLFGENGLCSPGVYLHYVMGCGAQPATLKQLMYIFEEGKRLFPRAKVCVTAVGEACWPVITLAILLGSDMVRIGIEDTKKLGNGEVATSNAQMVEEVARIAHTYGRKLASVEEARQMLMPL